MTAQPFRQLAARLGARLHLFERRPARLAGRQFALEALHFALYLAARRFELRQFLLQLLQMILVAGQLLAQQGQFFFLFGEVHGIRRILATALLAQAFAALGDGLQRALGVRLVGQLDLEALLAVAGARAQTLQLFLRLGVALLDLRRDVHLLVQALLGLLDAQAGDLLQFFPLFAVDREFLRHLAPVRQFALELGEACLELAARFAPVADLRLEPGHFGVGRIHVALRLMQRVAGGEVRLARFLGARLGFAQRRVLRLKFGHRALDFERQALALGFRLALPEQPEDLLALHQLLVQGMVAARDFGLRFELLHLVAEFEADVLDAHQVLARVLEPALGFLAPFLVARDASRLLEEDAQVVGLGLDDARDHALADDRVGTRPEAGAEEQVGDVLAPYLQVVDEVIRLPGARQHALDRQFRVLRPLAEGAAELVVENQLDRGARHRLAAGRPVEDDVLHRLAAQLRCFRLAEHPAHGVHDVGFAAAIGADDADQLPGQGDRGRVDKGLEAGEFEFGQAHGMATAAQAPCLDGGRIIPSPNFDESQHVHPADQDPRNFPQSRRRP